MKNDLDQAAKKPIRKESRGLNPLKNREKGRRYRPQEKESESMRLQQPQKKEEDIDPQATIVEGRDYRPQIKAQKKLRIHQPMHQEPTPGYKSTDKKILPCFCS